MYMYMYVYIELLTVKLYCIVSGVHVCRWSSCNLLGVMYILFTPPMQAVLSAESSGSGS